MKTEGRLLLSNSVWSLLNQLVRVGSLAVILIALSRYFGPTRFGSLAYGLAFVRIFAVIAGFGLDRVLVAQFVRTGTESRELLGITFRLKLLVALISYGALLVLVRLIAPADRLTFAIVALAGGGLVFQACDVYDYFFQAQNQFQLIFLGRTLPLLCSTGIKLVAIAMGAPLLVFALLETVEAALIAAALAFVFRSSRSPVTVPATAPAVSKRALLANGFPLLLGSLAVMIYMRADVLMLGRMVGYQAAGIYSAAAQISEGCTLVSVALVPALFPVLLRWRSLGLGFYHRQFEKLFLVAFLSGLAVAFLLTFFAPLIVQTLFGASFAPAADVLRILAWAPLFVFLGVTQSGYDITEGLIWMATLRTACGAAINVGLNYLLIPVYGPTGAATATVVSFAFSAFLLNYAQRPTRPVFGLQLRAMLLFPLFLRPARYE